MTDKTDSKEREAIARYRIGYPTDDRGMHATAPSGIPDPAGAWVLYGDHVASLAASAVTDCARCSGSGEDPEGFYDQSRGDAGHTHDGPCRTCNGSGVAASAGSEPVAHLWQHSETGRTRVVMPDMVVDACATWLLVGPLYLHPSPPEGMVGGWRPIETAPEGQMVVVGWLDPEDAEHPERHDFDLLEDGCWQQWHERAEHVEVIGGHGVSYTPPYTVWMPLPPQPTTSAGSGKGD